jgi:hypothetical protein
VCGVGEYLCLFAEIRREKNNKELLSFEMFGGWHFAPCLFRGKEKREKDNRELTSIKKKLVAAILPTNNSIVASPFVK